MPFPQARKILSLEKFRGHLTCTNKRAQAAEQKIARNESSLALPAMHLLWMCSVLVPSEFSHLRKRSAKKIAFLHFPWKLPHFWEREKVAETFRQCTFSFDNLLFFWFWFGRLLRRPPRRWNGLLVVHICWCTLGALLKMSMLVWTSQYRSNILIQSLLFQQPERGWIGKEHSWQIRSFQYRNLAFHVKIITSGAKNQSRKCAINNYWTKNRRGGSDEGLGGHVRLFMLGFPQYLKSFRDCQPA